jgi:hypothetical protein
MAQTNFTPISLYYSSTTGNVPTAGNLVNGELAMNIADGLLFYKDAGGLVKVFNSVVSPSATNLTGGAAGSVPYQSGPGTTAMLGIGTAGQVLSVSSGLPTWTTLSTLSVTSLAAGTGISVSAATGAVTVSNTGVSSFAGGTTGLTPAAATTGAISLAGTLVVANGGTGVATIAANNVILGNGTSAVQTVAPGTAGNVLTSNGTTWVSQAASGGSTAFNSVGSYCYVYLDNTSATAGGSYAAGNGFNQVYSICMDGGLANLNIEFNLSGTWRWMGAGTVGTATLGLIAIAVRIA